jgi:hypothetical protein
MSDWPENESTGALLAYSILYGALFLGVLIIFIGIGAETGIIGIVLDLVLIAVLYPFVGMIFFQVVKELMRRGRGKPRI